MYPQILLTRHLFLSNRNCIEATLFEVREYSLP